MSDRLNTISPFVNVFKMPNMIMGGMDLYATGYRDRQSKATGCVLLL